MWRAETKASALSDPTFRGKNDDFCAVCYEHESGGIEWADSKCDECGAEMRVCKKCDAQLDIDCLVCRRKRKRDESNEDERGDEIAESDGEDEIDEGSEIGDD